MSSRAFIKSLLALLMLLPAFGSAVTLDYNFETGNRFYTDGDYTRAISEYEKVIEAGYQSPELFYNLGNAYFREGQLGQAILNYLRAKKLSPRDEDIQANLEFARRFAIDRIEVTEEIIIFEYIDRFLDSFSLTFVTWSAAILYFLMVGLIIIRFVYRWVYIPNLITVLFALSFLFCSAFAAVKYDRDILTRRGVILAQQIDVKNGPGTDFNDQFTAHAGLVFMIERDEAGYYLVNFENRLKGWVIKEAVAEI